MQTSLVSDVHGVGRALKMYVRHHGTQFSKMLGKKPIQKYVEGIICIL